MNFHNGNGYARWSLLTFLSIEKIYTLYIPPLPSKSGYMKHDDISARGDVEGYGPRSINNTKHWQELLLLDLYWTQPIMNNCGIDHQHLQDWLIDWVIINSSNEQSTLGSSQLCILYPPWNCYTAISSFNVYNCVCLGYNVFVHGKTNASVLQSNCGENNLLFCCMRSFLWIIVQWQFPFKVTLK